METIGKYRILQELGKGATAIVYLCEDPDQHQQVAVKLVDFDRGNAAVSRRLRKLFRTEGTVARRLVHPNIVRVYDAVVEEKRAYIAMEYVQGESLERFCHIERLLPMHRVIGIIFKCCLALDYAYHQGVIHRDVKPANIMLDKDDNPKITDFGLALNIHKNRNQESTFVMGMGSPAYMSPEQVKGHPLNQKTDLYSLGVLLFQMLTGRLPFQAKNQATLVYKVLNTDVPSVTQLNPNLPATLDTIVKKAMEKDLFNRYKNGAEFAKELSAVRFELVDKDDEDSGDVDQAHFSALRALEIFADFECIELWELLRLSIWREVEAEVIIFAEGVNDNHFGVLVSGRVEVSVGGKALCQLEGGEVVGEMAYLHNDSSGRHATVTTLEPCQFLEIRSAALVLSSDELQERMQKTLISRVIDRLRAANRILAQQSQQRAAYGRERLR
ncbi:MAG: protein kinase [Zoogloeaceae bacterium]|jgi:serine/threonine protein kinase|nr:protein kinase [Zoogloeaceae bacterium]